jgi:hypothetical protein
MEAGIFKEETIMIAEKGNISYMNNRLLMSWNTNLY